MKQLALYIGGLRVDMDEAALIQMNFTMEDLHNPAVVKNSYSQQIKVQGTKTNNAIFGSFFRLDRVTRGSRATGAAFNALDKTPFVIYDELGAIIEQGYAKLDNIERTGENVQYAITLYGGLGEFFYSLSYTENGDKRTLADLDYLGTLHPDKELDFNITAEAVQTAWNALYSGGGGKWSVVNFAPAYNGLPEDFEADKAIFNPSISGFQTSKEEGGFTYGTRNGWSLVEFDKEYDEWQTKDMRSYLQRPVVSIRAIVEAITNPKNNGGFNVSLDSRFFNDKNPYYKDAWVTLPIIRSIEQKQVTGRYDLTFDADAVLSATDVEVASSGSLLGTSTSFRVVVHPSIRIDGVAQPTDGDELSMGTDRVALQLIAYDGTTVVGESGVRSFSSESDYADTNNGVFLYDSFDRVAHFEDDVILDLGGVENVTKLVLRVTPYITKQGGSTVVTSDAGTVYKIFGYDLTAGDGSYAEATTFPEARTGSLITKKMLLSSDATPADYLLSYCKAFGLHFLYDKVTRGISIVTRDTLYDGEMIDLTERIDYGKAMSVKPYSFDAKWYDFGWDYEEGEFAEYYEQTHGRPYGLKRLNTGYNFNSETKEMLDDNIYKGAVEALQREKYYLNLGAGSPIPAPFLDGGHKYKLYNGGASIEIGAPTPTSTTSIVYWNPSMPTYDKVTKMQFHDDENGAIDLRDVLCFYRGATTNYAEMHLSDDTPTMLEMNDGNPCWVLNGIATPNLLPDFGRHLYDGSTIVSSWDFGTPAEYDIPNVRPSGEETIYAKGWEGYLADRYDLDSKVVTAWVDLRGLQVGSELLRKFFYFEGCVWVLNAIRNYSLMGEETVECEFVKVKNVKNYKNGTKWQE